MAQPGHEKETYEEYLDKFKTKHTKDDTFTPPKIYNVVRDWAVKEYGLEGREILRPFWPGEDYTQVDYPTDCVVIDNPPFSIMSKICQFYTDHGIHFFLFANHVTLFNTLCNEKVNAIVTGNSITFENGARLPCSFLTDMGTDRVHVCGELYNIIMKAQEKEDRSLRKIVYPPEVIASARFTKFAKLGMDIRIKNMVYCSCVSSYHIFGGGGSSFKAGSCKTGSCKTGSCKTGSCILCPIDGKRD